MRAWLTAWLLLATITTFDACSSVSSTPEDHAMPAEPPTALAIMLDQKATLALTPAQVDGIANLEKKLAALNAPLEAQAHEAEKGVRTASSGDGSSAPVTSRRGMGGGRMGGRGRRGGGAPSSGSAPAAQGQAGSQADALRAKMADNHDAVLGEAFGLLGPIQREKARALLDDEGYDAPAENDAPK